VLEGPEVGFFCFYNNCSDQVIDMAQVQQIYPRLFTHIDVATSLLLKQDLVDVEFVREQNQRIFAKLCTETWAKNGFHQENSAIIFGASAPITTTHT
jgi:hypothetical protein